MAPRLRGAILVSGDTGAVSSGDRRGVRGRHAVSGGDRAQRPGETSAGDLGVSCRSSCFAPSITARDALHRAIDRKVGPQSCFRPCKGPPLHCSLPLGVERAGAPAPPPRSLARRRPRLSPRPGPSPFLRRLSLCGPCSAAPCSAGPPPRTLHGGLGRPHRPPRQPRRPQAVRGRCLPLAVRASVASCHLSRRPRPTRSSACSAALAAWAPRP